MRVYDAGRAAKLRRLERLVTVLTGLSLAAAFFAVETVATATFAPHLTMWALLPYTVAALAVGIAGAAYLRWLLS